MLQQLLQCSIHILSKPHFLVIGQFFCSLSVHVHILCMCMCTRVGQYWNYDSTVNTMWCWHSSHVLHCIVYPLLYTCLCCYTIMDHIAEIMGCYLELPYFSKNFIIPIPNSSAPRPPQESRVDIWLLSLLAIPETLYYKTRPFLPCGVRVEHFHSATFAYLQPMLKI